MPSTKKEERKLITHSKDNKVVVGTVNLGRRNGKKERKEEQESKRTRTLNNGNQRRSLSGHRTPCAIDAVVKMKADKPTERQVQEQKNKNKKPEENRREERKKTLETMVGGRGRLEEDADDKWISSNPPITQTTVRIIQEPI